MHTLVSKLVTLSFEKHRCRSRQLFGGAKDFCPNFPKLARKILQRKWPPKNDCISFHVCHIFSSQSTSSTIFAQISPKFAQISPNLPEKNLIKTWPQKTSLHFYLECYSVKSKHKKRFCKGIHTYCPNFPTDFARIFTKSKILGVRLHPLPPASCTSVEKYYMVLTEIQLKICRFHGSFSQKGSRPLHYRLSAWLSPGNKQPLWQIKACHFRNIRSIGLCFSLNQLNFSQAKQGCFYKNDYPVIKLSMILKSVFHKGQAVSSAN